MTTLELLVRKDQLSTSRLRERDDTPLAPGQVRARIDRFALTANNITYAAFGDAMHYWDFYPSGEEGWGVIPVWGFGHVSQSAHPGVAVGERLYGYFPMSDSVVLQPERLTQAGFVDATAHRTSLPAVYNQYLRCNTDPFHTPGTEDVLALLRPLFMTSWLIADFLEDNRFFGATAAGTGTMLLSSASSKTAYGTAHALAGSNGIEVVGLTSAANVGFCESLGCYHRVLAYEQLDRVAADAVCVYVDFAGNAALRQAIHQRFGGLRYSCAIGGTHVTQLGGGKDLPGPKPTLFFAPSQVKKRHGEWGAQLFGQRLVEAWKGFVPRVTDPAAPWLVVHRHRGADAVSSVYRQVLAGAGDPRIGHILSLRS